MSRYSIKTTRKFTQQLKKLDPPIRERILDAIEQITETPYTGSSLIYSERRLYKYRVGDYRIIYEIEETEKMVLFLLVDHRSRVYRNV